MGLRIDDRGPARGRRDRDVEFELVLGSTFLQRPAHRRQRWTRKQRTSEFVQLPIRVGFGAFGAQGSQSMTCSADGIDTHDGRLWSTFKKHPRAQKRAFQKVETKDIAGKWCKCYVAGFFPGLFCSRKTALNEDQYEESGLAWILGLPGCMCGTRTRIYVNGHPTNGFAGAFLNDSDPDLVDHWHRDPGCAGSDCFFAKKLG